MALDLAQLQQILEGAQKADALKSEIKRALRKVSSLLVNLQTTVEDAEALMSDDYTPIVKERKPRTPREVGEVEAEAPYGRKKDGTPKSKPGRNKE